MLTPPPPPSPPPALPPTHARGGWVPLPHVTQSFPDLVDEDFIEEGFMFDGSSNRGLEKHRSIPTLKLMLDTALRPMLIRSYAEKNHLAVWHCSSIVEP